MRVMYSVQQARWGGQSVGLVDYERDGALCGEYFATGADTELDLGVEKTKEWVDAVGASVDWSIAGEPDVQDKDQGRRVVFGAQV